MKISKQRLKQIIKEEIGSSLQPSDQPAEKSEQPAGEETKTLMALSNHFLNLSKQMRASKIKGLDPSEVQLFAKIVNNLIKLTSGKSAASNLKVLDAKIEQLLGTK